MVITDKVLTHNGADFTFVCGKVPFAVSCSSDLPHKDSNMIDLDLINKMKIPLKNIRVSRISIQGHDLRCVGVISQTIQCVVDGKISGTIHLYAKVVRDLYSSISTDCLASRRTFFRLMGKDAIEEPPDDPSIEVLGGDDGKDDEEDDIAMTKDDEENDIAVSKDVEEDDIAVSKDDEEGDVTTTNAKGDDVTSITNEVPIDYSHCYSSPPLYQDDPELDACYDSDGNYDELLTKFRNGEFPEYDYYQGGALFKISRNKSPKKAGGRKPSSRSMESGKHCQYCFVGGQPIKVTRSHNIMDIDCPSMTDDDRRRIHGDKETDRWLARMYGYHD